MRATGPWDDHWLELRAEDRHTHTQFTVSAHLQRSDNSEGDFPIYTLPCM